MTYRASWGSGGGGATTWVAVTGKPSVFPPDTHGHAIADVTGLQAALDGKQASGSYAAASHTHLIADVTGLQAALDGKQVAGSYQPLATVLTNTTAAFTTAQETKLAGIATGATANSADAALLARANHTGTQAVGTITGLGTAALAATGDFAPIAHVGAGGTAHANAVAAGAAGFMTGADKTKLDAISGTNTGDQNLSAYATTAAVAAAYQPLDTQLTDLAALSYAGNASKYVRINAAANGFEVVTLAGGGDLVAANNLSDLASAATARTNLSVPATTRAINTTAPLTGGGDLSADRTIAISAATTSTAGSMSAADKIKVDNDLTPVKYDAAGAALGPTIADYFTASISLQAASIYEIDCHAYFLKTTAGTVVWTWLFSNAPTMATSRWKATPITGFTTSTITGAELTGLATAEAVAAMAHAASGSLTTAVRHSFMFRVRVRTNAATTIQLRATESAGTITPQAGSYMRARKIV